MGADEYDFAVEESPLRAAETTKAGLLELSIWPPRQGERSNKFPLWCDLRFNHLQEEYNKKWRIEVYLTRAELVASFSNCNPARGSLYGETVLAPHETATERAQEQSDSSQALEGSISASGDANSRPSFSIKGLFSAKRSHSSSLARTIDMQVKDPRVSPLPSSGSGKVWQITDRKGSLRGTYLIAPSEEKADIQPLCYVVASGDQFDLGVSLDIRLSDIGFNIESRDRSWFGFWSFREKPNQHAIIKMLVKRSFIEKSDRPSDGRLRLVQARIRGTRKAALEGRIQ